MRSRVCTDVFKIKISKMKNIVYKCYTELFKYRSIVKHL